MTKKTFKIISATITMCGKSFPVLKTYELTMKKLRREMRKLYASDYQDVHLHINNESMITFSESKLRISRIYK